MLAPQGWPCVELLGPTPQLPIPGGGIPLLVALLTSGTAQAKGNAAAALCALARGSDANQDAVIDAGGIPPLAVLLTSGTDQAKQNAAGALLVPSSP